MSVVPPRPLTAVTQNSFTETGTRGCNPSFVVTSEGVVVIDTPQLPTHAVAMRRQAEEFGDVRFVINTEHHVDHIFGNYYFKGAGQVVHHRGVHENFMTVTPNLDPFELAVASTKTHDPAGIALLPDRTAYYADPNKKGITFTGDAVLYVGEHTFELLHTPGHTPGQIAVHVPQERIVFTGDSIFENCQTWLMASDVNEWLRTLTVIEALDVDYLVPGHGPITTTKSVAAQRSVLLGWQSAVADAVARGWTREETINRVNFTEAWPTDVGLDHMMDYIQTLNAASLYDSMAAPQRAQSAPSEGPQVGRRPAVEHRSVP